MRLLNDLQQESGKPKAIWPFAARKSLQQLAIKNCNLGQTTRSRTPCFSIYKMPILLHFQEFLGLQGQIYISWTKPLTSIWITWTIYFSLQHNKYLLSISSGQVLTLMIWAHKWTIQRTPTHMGSLIWIWIEEQVYIGEPKVKLKEKF